jgi:hypothetical protein
VNTFAYILLGALITISMGVTVRFIAKRLGMREFENINPLELIIGSVVCTAIVLPIVTMVGANIARNNAMQFNEYWSAVEASADVATTPCTRDGSCRHTYNCDPYTVPVTYTDSKGRSHVRMETRYHSCPYVDAEMTYTVTDTMGATYTLGDHWFPGDPKRHLWQKKDYKGIFHETLPNVSSGIPAAWAAAKARLEANNPGGTTSRHEYKNYLLASSADIYAKSSNAIAEYRKAGLMPKPATTIHSAYLANKVYFVGPNPANEADWQEALQRLDGYLGSQRQGDMHVIVVTTKRIPSTGGSPDRYSQAVEAYWQSKALGKDTLSKNGIGLVLGLSEPDANGKQTIAWSRAFTGMPRGNEALNIALRDIRGADATPEALFAKDTGAVWKPIFAKKTGFHRIEMKDYEYLTAAIQPSTTARVVTLLVAIVLSGLVWALFFCVDLTLPGKGNNRTSSDRFNRRIRNPYSR